MLVLGRVLMLPELLALPAPQTKNRVPLLSSSGLVISDEGVVTTRTLSVSVVPMLVIGAVQGARFTGLTDGAIRSSSTSSNGRRFVFSVRCLVAREALNM